MEARKQWDDLLKILREKKYRDEEGQEEEEAEEGNGE